MPLSIKISQSIIGALSKVTDIGNPAVEVNVSRDQTFESAYLNQNNADRLFSDTRTLAASATEDLDLVGLLLNDLGESFTAAEVVGLYVSADAANTNNVVIGGAATNTFIGPFGAATGTMVIKPGEYVFLQSKTGWPVTATTADLLKVLNSAAGTPVNYTIVIVARSVAY